MLHLLNRHVQIFFIINPSDQKLINYPKIIIIGPNESLLLGPNSFDPLQIFRIMPEIFKQALEKLESGSFQDSVSLFEQSLNAAKNRALLHLSKAHLELGNYQECRQICTDIIKENSELEQAHINLIVCLALLGQHSQSLNICENIISLKSKCWKLYFAKAYVLALQGKFQQASINYSISITKNLLNDPKSYILQAGCLATFDQLTVAIKSMHYAQIAMKEDEKKNCQGHYRFQIVNIKLALKYFEAYRKKIIEAELQGIIKEKQQEAFLKKLIKIVSRTVMFGSLAFKHWNNGEPKQIQVMSDNVSEINSMSARSKRIDAGYVWSEVCILEQGLNMKLRESHRLKTKESLSSEVETKRQIENKIVCEWLRQKCSIF